MPDDLDPQDVYNAVTFQRNMALNQVAELNARCAMLARKLEGANGIIASLTDGGINTVDGDAPAPDDSVKSPKFPKLVDAGGPPKYGADDSAGAEQDETVAPSEAPADDFQPTEKDESP